MNRPPITSSSAKPPPLHPLSDTEIELRLLMEAIYLKYSYDFRNYTVASQKRRVLHALDQLGLPSISALQERSCASRRCSGGCCSSSPSR